MRLDLKFNMFQLVKYYLQSGNVCFKVNVINHITPTTIFRCISPLFDKFVHPGFIHSDRGRQPELKNFNVFRSERGVARSGISPYNKQNDRYNAVTVRLIDAF